MVLDNQFASFGSKESFSQRKFQKDIYEIIGFSNGLKPFTDIREGTGMLGIISLIHFLETVQNIRSKVKKV